MQENDPDNTWHDSVFSLSVYKEKGGRTPVEVYDIPAQIAREHFPEPRDALAAYRAQENEWDSYEDATHRAISRAVDGRIQIDFEIEFRTEMAVLFDRGHELPPSPSQPNPDDDPLRFFRDVPRSQNPTPTPEAPDAADPDNLRDNIRAHTDLARRYTAWLQKGGQLDDQRGFAHHMDNQHVSGDPSPAYQLFDEVLRGRDDTGEYWTTAAIGRYLTGSLVGMGQDVSDIGAAYRAAEKVALDRAHAQEESIKDAALATELGAEIIENHSTIIPSCLYPVAYKFDDTAAAIEFMNRTQHQSLLYVDGDGASIVGDERAAMPLEPKPLDFDYRADGLRKSAIDGGRAMARAAEAGDERAANYMVMADGDEKTAYYMAMSEAAGRLMNQALLFREQRQGEPSQHLDDAVNEARKLGIVSLPPLRRSQEKTPDERPRHEQDVIRDLFREPPDTAPNRPRSQQKYDNPISFFRDTELDHDTEQGPAFEKWARRYETEEETTIETDDRDLDESDEFAANVVLSQKLYAATVLIREAETAVAQMKAKGIGFNETGLRDAIQQAREAGIKPIREAAPERSVAPDKGDVERDTDF